ncbi:MAG: hypothetical protein IKC87_06235 [Clostridia bacterium]|nr:hypothetical protein [Clostridia bacterium]
MEFRLKEEAKSVKTRIILAIFAVLGGAAAALLAQLGVLVLPLAAAPLAVIFLVETKRKRVFSIIVPILLLVIDFVLNLYYSFTCFGIIAVAFVIFLTVRTGFLAKTESAMLATVVLAIVSAVSLVMLGCYLFESFDLSVVLEGWHGVLSEMREVWITAIEEQVALDTTGELAAVLTPEVSGAMFDAYANGIYAIVVIVAFIAVGISLKLFAWILKKYAERPKVFDGWRFAPTPVYAYFYMALYLIGSFGMGTDAVSVAISALSTVFMFIFAYVGIVFTNAYLKMRGSDSASTKVILIIIIVLFFSISLSILSFVGVFATVMLDKLKPLDGNYGGDNKDIK